MKIAFVVQRYGREVNGGAEYHCRLVAEHLSKYYDVEVITTCAIDYTTWKNEYTEGLDAVNDIPVRRFSVDKPRDVNKFNRFSEKLFSNPEHTVADEIEWMRLQGPYSTKLLSFLSSHKDDYDYFIFFTYLYCTTFFGLPLVKEKAFLVPTAHDEPPVYLGIFKELFGLPKAFIYNTDEEKKLITRLFGNRVPGEVVGVGIDVPDNLGNGAPGEFAGYGKYLVYVGRIDESKGCGELFALFRKFKDETESPLKLMLIGKPFMKIPDEEDIVSLGFVSEKKKFEAISSAVALVMPSQYESLSMVLLEAWTCRRPVLVNGNCAVLKGQCIRSNAGLWYENYEEFRECLGLLLRDEILGNKMGKMGRGYVINQYSWGAIEGKYREMLGSAGK